MKKVLVVFAAIFACIQFSMAGDVITQDVMQLPLTARNFINRYFTNPQVSYIKIESEILQSKKYEVTLSDRTELEFDSKGNWLEVDCKKTAVPAALVPNFAKKYVEANFPGQIHGIGIRQQRQLAGSRLQENGRSCRTGAQLCQKICGG